MIKKKKNEVSFSGSVHILYAVQLPILNPQQSSCHSYQ